MGFDEIDQEFLNLREAQINTINIIQNYIKDWDSKLGAKLHIICGS